jgi:hypothetical protein
MGISRGRIRREEKGENRRKDGLRRRIRGEG